jgi:hypothetical protein
MPSEEYRQHAAECLRIAENLGDPQGRAGLIAMAQAWLQLARQAEKNLDIFVSKAPEPRQHVAQQQQQPQPDDPKKKGAGPFR